MKELLQHFMITLLVVLSMQMAGHAYENYYVKSSATGAGDGTSWTDAFTDLQTAIDVAATGDIICVAVGSYLPTHRHVGDSSRHSTFYINKDIIIYGGFSGTPGTEGTLNGRDPNLHVTILSGDIGVSDDHTDNAFHVVYFDHVSDSSRLDGFVVEHGNGFGGSGFEAIGAGIFNNAEITRSNPVIANCIIRDNQTSESGGGLFNYAQGGGTGNLLLMGCSFIRNRASGGGGIANYADEVGIANPTLISCSFMGNSAPTAGGGAVSNIGHDAIVSPRFINCIISGNFSGESSAAFASFVTGTGIGAPEFVNCALSGNANGSINIVDIGAHNSIVRIRNSILWGNGSGANHGLTLNNSTADAAFSIIPFGFPGEGIIGLDPMFVSQPPIDSVHTLGDLHLLPGSPAFDAGRTTDVPAGIVTDLDGNPRFINALNGQAGTVDIGPYEFQGNSTGVSDFLFDADWHVYPNPATEQVVVSITAKGEGGELRFLDARGSAITTQHLQSGQDDYAIEVSQLPAGTYFVHLLRDGLQDVKKIVLQ